MSVVYSMYDALVSINVPDEKARAVIDAMEHEMMEKLATRADLRHARELTARDLQAFRTEVSRDLEALRTEMHYSLDKLQSRLTSRLGTLCGAWAGMLFALLKLTS